MKTMKTFTENLNLKTQSFLLVAVLFALLGFGPAAQAVPINDNFINRIAVITMSNAVTTVTGSNVGATAEPGEPLHFGSSGGKSVWWKWIAPLTGTATINTTNSDFDTILAVYLGSSVTNLALIANNDDFVGLGTRSQVTFPAVAGTEYEITVDGFGPFPGGASGNITLNVSIAPVPPPSNDNFANKIVVTTSGSLVTTVTGSNVNATKEPGEPPHFSIYGGKSVWWTWTAPLTGTATINTTNSTFDTILAIYTGASLTNLTLLTNNDDIVPGIVQSQVTFPAVAGTTYRIAVDGFGLGINANEGNVTLNVSVAPAPPPINDNFVSRITVTTAGSAVTTVTGSNVNATKEIGEPTHSGISGGKSVWWTWTAPISGTATINTTNSNFDTILAIYTGSSVGGLTLVTNNDDISPSVLQSQVIFPAIAGTTYQIAVDGFGGGLTTKEGNVTLNVSVAPVSPLNDNFINRITVIIAGSSAVATVTGSNVNATKEIGEPTHFGFSGGKSVWWKWTAPVTGMAAINTLGSSFDTILAVYTGSSVGGLTLITNNDDFNGPQSYITFPAVAGVEYQIAVDGFGSGVGASEGSVRLNVGLPPSLSIGLLPGNVRLSLEGIVGASYQIEYKNDLNTISWTTLTSFVLPSSPFTFSTIPPIGSNVFYRAVTF